jgi:tetratricopeptide (TPR) repeat protein
VDVETHVRAARQHHGAGELHAARVEIERARQLNPTGRDLVNVLITAGIVNREIGDIAAAIEDLQRCIGLLPDYPNLAAVMLGPAWYNLGLALRQARRLQESIDAYGVAIGMFRADGLDNYLRMALQNRAWAFCVAGNAQSAGADLAESAPLCTTPGALAEQRIGEAFYLSLTGGDAEAVRICAELAEDVSAPADVASHALWLAGRLALASGAMENAQLLANQAVERATRCGGENRCLADAGDLLNQVRQQKMRGGMAV